LAWLDHVLQIRETAQDDFGDVDYQLEVVDSPTELRDRIIAANAQTRKARLVAGYCWDWVSKNKDPNAFDIEFEEHGFAMQWNLNDDGGLWLEKDHSIDQVGCIHTVQGLELDVVGVIIGPDLVVRNGRVTTRPEYRARMDKSLSGYKKTRKEDPEQADRKVDRIIRNTYRTLMSRGLRGCLIWCTDPETQAYFEEQVGLAMAASEAQREGDTAPHQRETDTAKLEAGETPEDSLRLIPSDELQPAQNAVPFVDLPAALFSASRRGSC
jgi:DUF2075 family protein